jgi:hypothetical protein
MNAERTMSKEGDLVLVHVEDSPAFFARIECIDADVKTDWYRVTLLVLQVPVVEVTWILKQEYIDGSSFTMGGKNVLMERVVAPSKQPPPEKKQKEETDTRQKPGAEADTGKVISLFERK